jgi:ParB family chromosome partitioning protein
MNKNLINIPLTHLQRAKDNVRRTGNDADIGMLAASIEAHGLLQSLTVRKLPANGREKPRYEVIAGGRRLQALKSLVKRRKLAKSFGVPCRLVDEKRASGIEVSLVENVVRLSLHPADQFEAFAQLQAQGLGAADIAARFGVSQRTAEQRLKLAAVSPRLMAEYKQDHLTLDQLTAFAVCDDHAAQEHVWFEAPLFDRSPQAIRRALTKAHVDGSDRRARFIGIEAYEQAGGTVTRDLFEQDAAYFADSQLLDRLVAEKLQLAAESIRKEGWSFIQVQPVLDYEALARFGRVTPQQAKLSSKDSKRLNTLSKRYDALISKIDEDASEADVATLDSISMEIEQLTRKHERWSKKSLGQAGAILSLTSAGTLQVTRGLVPRQAGKPNGREVPKEAPSEGPKVAAGYSEGLLQDLSAHRTAALRETLAGQPELALTAVVHALALKTLFGVADATCVEIRPVSLDLAGFGEGLPESPAVRAMADRLARWTNDMPRPEDIWPWLNLQLLEVKLDLLAYLVACSVNAVQRTRQGGADDRLIQADLLACAGGLDMTRWWRPTAASYFDRVSKDQILQAVSEQLTSQAAANIASLKKKPMAVRAEQLLSETGWLPSPLRNSANGATSVKANS